MLNVPPIQLDNQVQTAGLKLLKYNKLHIYYTHFPSANSDTELIIRQSILGTHLELTYLYLRYNIH